MSPSYKKSFLKLHTDERGLSTVEYIIILTLIAVAAIGAWNKFGDAVIGQVEEKTGQIENL